MCQPAPIQLERQRHRAAPHAHGGGAAPGGLNSIAEGAGGPRAHHGQHVLRVAKQRPTGGIGEHDAAMGVDEKYPGGKGVERVREHRAFFVVKIDNISDQHRAAHMRHDQLHAPSHDVVDEPFLLIAENPEQGKLVDVLSRVAARWSTHPCGFAHSL